MATKKAADNRSKSWLAVVYPESLPENWRNILIEEYQIEWVCSPLHEFDINPDGEKKKPHYHLLLVFGGLKSFEQIKQITDRLNAPIPQRCHSAKGAVRYMLHLDNPEKYQYPRSELQSYGGVDLDDLLRPSSSDRYKVISQMCDFIIENDIREYRDLFDYARQNEFDTWFPALCDNCSYVIGQYIKSYRASLTSQ